MMTVLSHHLALYALIPRFQLTTRPAPTRSLTALPRRASTGGMPVKAFFLPPFSPLSTQECLF